MSSRGAPATSELPPSDSSASEPPPEPPPEPWIEEAKRFVGFSSDDERRLRAFHAVARGDYDGVVARFYEVVARHPDAWGVIRGGASRLDGLRQNLAAWLDAGTGGAHDEGWYGAGVRIGRRHVEVGLPPRYMFAAIDVVRIELHALARRRCPDDAAATVDAIDRWLDLELAIMLQAYQEDSERRLVARGRAADAERLETMRRLCGSLAHAIQNPINAAALQLQLLARRLRQARTEPGLAEPAGLAIDELARVSRLVHDFLEVAHPAPLGDADVDLVGVAARVVERLAPDGAARGVRVELAAPAPAVVGGDVAQLEGVLEAIVANAIEAARARVEVAIEVTQDGARLRVRDDGDGLHGEILARLFEPFVTTKDGRGGTSLSTAYGVVARHGGTLAAHNEGGAVFTLALPRLARA